MAAHKVVEGLEPCSALPWTARQRDRVVDIVGPSDFRFFHHHLSLEHIRSHDMESGRPKINLLFCGYADAGLVDLTVYVKKQIGRSRRKKEKYRKREKTKQNEKNENGKETVLPLIDTWLSECLLRAAMKKLCFS